MSKCYHSLKNYEEEIRALELAYKFEETLDKRIQLKLQMIDILVDNADYVQAKLHIEGYKKLTGSTSLDVLYYEAKICNKMGDYTTAKNNMIEATRSIRSPALKDIARYYYELGYAYYKQKEYDLASQAWEKASFGSFKSLIAKYDPNYYFRTAQAMYEIMDYPQAVRYLQETLKIRNDFVPAKLMLARIAIRSVRQDEAIKFYSEAIALENDIIRKANLYEEQAELMYQSGRFKESVNSAMNCIQIKPHEYDAIMIEAMAYYRMKNFEDAVYKLESVTKNKDLEKKLLSKFNFALGIVFRAQQQYDKAMTAYKEASQHDAYSEAAHTEMNSLQDELKSE
jgi:tetratricopeptide (TPR) repeat protein